MNRISSFVFIGWLDHLYRRLNSAQYDENWRNRPKLTFKWTATSNFLRILRHWYNIRNQRIKLHQEKTRSKTLKQKVKKRGSPYAAPRNAFARARTELATGAADLTVFMVQNMLILILGAAIAAVITDKKKRRTDFILDLTLIWTLALRFRFYDALRCTSLRAFSRRLSRMRWGRIMRPLPRMSCAMKYPRNCNVGALNHLWMRSYEPMGKFHVVGFLAENYDKNI